MDIPGIEACQYRRPVASFKFRVMVWLFDEFGGIGQPLDSRWEGKVIDPEYLSEFACYPKSRCD